MADNGKPNGIDRKKPREILELTAREVSLVDRPAIRRTFLVTKRQEQTMGAFDNNENQENLEKANSGETKTEEAEKANSDETKEDTEKAKAVPPTTPEKCPKCGAVMGADGVCPKCGYKSKACGTPKVKKSLEYNTETGEIEIDGEPVEKGTKGFTGKRTEALGAAVKSLMGILSEVQPEVAKSIISDLVKQQLPADLKWTSGTVARSVGVTKSKEDSSDLVKIGELIKSALEPVVKKVEDLGTQVSDISKMRTAPQSAEGATDTVKKSEEKKSFWSGLPLK